ncbi:MAG TPA: hypothetical protein VLB47_02055, partial [Solirubrobacteraceae bacterium]|nr:hypothetical protein [Solirubrobacteraceae bacterium]
LALTGVSDAPVAAVPLSSVLVLQVEDVTRPAAPARRYAGPLAALGRVGVGRIAPGERRVFRFAVTFPGGRPPSADNPLQGARTTAVFTWSATGAVVARPRAPRRATASLAARRRQRPARRRVRATLRCSAACRATISGTVRVRGTRRTLRTRTVGVRLRRAGARRVVVRLPRAAVAAGRRASSLRLRLRARVGGRTVVARRTVRLVR